MGIGGHIAFEAKRLLTMDRLSSFEIESLEMYGNKLLLGTRQGMLLVFSLFEHQVTLVLSHTLDRTIKQFSKRALLALRAVPPLNLLLSLSDGVVSVHDLSDLRHLNTIMKNCTIFDVLCKSRDGIVVALGVKNVLHTVALQSNGSSRPLRSQQRFPFHIQQLAFCKDTICVLLKSGDIYLTDSKAESEFFHEVGCRPGTTSPFTVIGNQYFGLSSGSTTAFFDLTGKSCFSIKWSDIPTTVIYQKPYLMAIVAKGIEIAITRPNQTVQLLEMDKPKFILSREEKLFVGLGSLVTFLKPVNNLIQIEELMKEYSFDLAMKLVDMLPEDSIETVRVRVRVEQAIHFFAQGLYKEALSTFAQPDCNVHPIEVICLYPVILPENVRENCIGSARLRKLTTPTSDLKDAMMCLIDHLFLRRQGVSQSPDSQIAFKNLNGEEYKDEKHTVLMVIDTALVKCYLETDQPHFVGPLIRYPDCTCNLEITEKELKAYQLYADLVELYRRNELHKPALELLEQHSSLEGSPLYGYLQTVRYLQSLGADNIKLIFYFAEVVLRLSSDDGLLIFTGEPTRGRPGGPLGHPVLDYLEQINPELLVRYLWFLIDSSANESRDVNIHNRLAYLLLGKYRSASLTRDEETLIVRRDELLDLFRKSTLLDWNKLLPMVPKDSELAAIIYGKKGMLTEALDIYVNKLGGIDRAEIFCEEQVRGGKTDIYQQLVRLLRASPSHQDRLLALLNGPAGAQVSSTDTLELLPADSKLVQVMPFLCRSFTISVTDMRHWLLAAELSRAKHNRLAETQIRYQRQGFKLTEESRCCKCQERLHRGAFARHPDGSLYHILCYRGELTQSLSGGYR